MLSQHYWPEAMRINSFVDALRAAGVDVTVLTGQPNYPAGKVFDGYRWHASGIELHPSGYEIARVPLVPRGKAGHLRMALNYVSFIASGSMMGRRLLARRRFDAIFVYGTSPILQGFVGMALRRKLGARLVLWVQDLWPHALTATGYVRAGWLLGAVESVVNLLYRRADLVLAQSEGFATVIRSHAAPVPVEVFPNPGESGDAPSDAAEDDGVFEVVFAGNLGRAQALETVVAAAELLHADPGIRICLYGSGAMEDWIAGQIAARGLANLRLGGRLPPEAMPTIFRKASAALMTLVDDKQLGLTVPSKLQSYLGAGVPVIAAAGSEARRVVEDAGAGIACPPEDAAALAAAIVRLRATPLAERAAMRTAGRAYYARHYDPQTLACRLRDRLGELVNERATR